MRKPLDKYYKSKLQHVVHALEIHLPISIIHSCREIIMNISRFIKHLPYVILALASLYLPSITYGAHHGQTNHPPVARLGVLLMNVPFQQLESLKLDYGVRVERVISGSPAEKAGLQTDDIIFKFDGKPVYSVQRLQWHIRKAQPGANVQLQYAQKGEFKTANAQFTTNRIHQTAQSHFSPARTVIGVIMQSITDGLREYFGVPENVGVLIAEVKKGSPAETAGIKAGDVITKLEKTSVHGLSDVYRALDAVDPGTKISVDLVRKNANQTVTVSPEANPTTGWHHGFHGNG